MLAMSQSDLTTHVFRDLLKINVKAGATSSAASFKILVGPSYGSEAVCSSRSFISFYIPTRVIPIIGIEGKRSNRHDQRVYMDVLAN